MSSLEGASRYLNNLLLARGLLPNGKPVDFAHSTCDSDSAEATMSRIINLIHDLVLRRDREFEQHEAMAASIRSLRAAEIQRHLEVKQLQDRNQSLQSDTATARAQERGTRISFKKLESQIKELKEQNLKMKSMLDQVRAKCTSDVRKRDSEIEKLKTHLLSVQRGKRDQGGMKINLLNPRSIKAGAGSQESRQNADNADWCLQHETNDFLTAIVNETSAENVCLRKIVAGTLRTLQEMTGYEPDLHQTQEDGVGIPGQYRKSRCSAEGLVPTDMLSGQLDTILQHCRSILKDPSFVPIDEVQVRDEEIAKLRVGWEKMADRWKEAVSMMDQWKQRMLSEGKSADIGELSDLSFGRSVAILPDGQPVLKCDIEFSIFDESKLDEGSVRLAEEETYEEESELELEPVRDMERDLARKRLASSPARRGVRLPRLVEGLSEVSGNAIAASITDDQQSHPLSHGMKSDSGYENCTPLTSSKLEELSVPQKLAAIEAEAKAVLQAQHEGSSRKRKALSQSHTRKSRRRSTLTPEQLANIMSTRQG